MLQPKRMKFRKMHKGRNRGLCYRWKRCKLRLLSVLKPLVVVV